MEPKQQASTGSAGGTNQTPEEVAAIASSMGLEAFFPLPNEVVVDLDGPGPSPEQLRKIWIVLGEMALSLQSELRTTSKSGNSHLYMRFDTELEPVDRMVLQLVFGSDPVHEVYSLGRYWAGSEKPTALFEKPEEAERVRMWRKEKTPVPAEGPVILTDGDVPF